MTSNDNAPGQPAASITTDDPAPGTLSPAACKRPGSANTLPPPGRGRARQFCSDDCARAYHNHAPPPAPAPTTAPPLPEAPRPPPAPPPHARHPAPAPPRDAAGHATDRAPADHAARDAPHRADPDTSRAHQAETDARAETTRVRADAARE